MRLLGPVQVIRAGREVGLGGPRPRALLALLVLEAGRVVPAGRLAEEAWRGNPPPGAAKTLRSYLSRLRTLLAPDAALVARGGGYALGVDPGVVDAIRFERLAGAGQAALSQSDPAGAASHFREALGLWRGRVLADVCEVEPLAREAARLGTLSAAEIEAHLADRFRFLAYRRPAADPRHQALRAAMDWSYELLSAGERRVLGELSVFAGTFGLAQAAEVCSGGDQLAGLELIDQLAGKSLVAAEPAEDGTRYRLLDTVRYYAADRLAEAGGTDAARHRHAAAFLALAERERQLAVLAREQDNFRAALEWSQACGDQAGPWLARALGDFWLGRGLLAEGRDWLEGALVQDLTDQRLRADLLRLLGAVLCEGGDLDRADAVLSEGSQVAAAAGAPAVQARIRVLRADVRNLQGLGNAEALAECEAAAAVLDAEGDLDGLSEALTAAGRLRFWLGDIPASQVVLERAIACARHSGNHRAQMRASHWLAVTYHVLPIPADTAVARAEQLLRDASGDAWAEADLLKPLCVLYAHVGRAADARAAIDRSQSIFAGFGAKLTLAEGAIPAALVGLILGDPVAAERYARQGYEACRAIGQRGGYVVDLAASLRAALRIYEDQRATVLAERARTTLASLTATQPGREPA